MANTGDTHAVWIKQKSKLWTATLLALVCLTYANSFRNGFHFDDSHTVVDNPYIRSPRNIPRFFSDATTFSVLPANRSYRPLVSTSLAIDYALGGGLKPVFFHLDTFVAFLLQIVAMQLLFTVILERAAPGGPNTALVAVSAAAWHGLHPATAETVNYVIQRADVFSTLGVVAALLLFARWPLLRATGMYLIPFALALLSKPPAIAFPALLFAYIAMFEAPDRKRISTAAVQSVPAFVTGAALMALSAWMTPKTFTPSTLPGYSYRITQPFVLLRYFGSFFLPVHLNVDSDLAAFNRLTANALWGFLFVAVLIASIVLLARGERMRPIAFGLLWFLISSLPTSLYPLAEVENDHRMFMPFVGLALAAAWAAYLVLEHLAILWPGQSIWRVAGILSALLLCGYAYGAHVRNEVWRSEESLWLDDVRKCPRNGRGLMNYALTQMALGRYGPARVLLERALLFTPDYPTLEINLGAVYGALEQASLASQHFQRALALAPGSDEAHFYYGRWLYENGRLAEAISHLQTAFRLNPSRPGALGLLLLAYKESGDANSARRLARQALAMNPGDRGAADFLNSPCLPSADYWIDVAVRQCRQDNYAACLDASRRALAIQPSSAIALNNLGAAYAGLGQWDLAIRAERDALGVQPDLAIAQNNLASYLQQQSNPAPTQQTPEYFLNASVRLHQAGRYQESIAAAKSALRLKPDYAEAWNNIAADYSSLGQWDEAIHAAQEAIRLKPDFQLARNNLSWALSQKQISRGK